MSDSMVVLLVVFAAVVGGVAFGYLLMRTRIVQARERGRAELAQELAAVAARLDVAQDEIRALGQRLVAAEREVDLGEDALRHETGLRTAAEERNLRVPVLEAELQRREALLAGLNIQLRELDSARVQLATTLDKERLEAAEKLALLEQAKAELGNAFRALSADALRSNNEQFLTLARTQLEQYQSGARQDLESRQAAIGEIVKPVRESLEKVDARIVDLEKARAGAYEGLTQQVRQLLETQQQLRNETGNLVKALRQPNVRGRWGEIQLRRVVELAGMLNYCDFREQESVDTDEGRIRPDLIVRLPNRKVVVVDAKAPLSAYLDALEAPDEATRVARLVDHARQIGNHIKALSAKKYWEQFDSAPEFVVLFLPGEIFFSAALEQDPGLIEMGVDNRVIIATPTTLIALLRAVAYGWRQEQIAENAQAISKLGRELYERLRTLADHWGKVGESLGKAVHHYNRATSSLETRVLVTGRRFRELDGASEREGLDELPAVESVPRELQSEELRRLPTPAPTP